MSKQPTEREMEKKDSSENNNNNPISASLEQTQPISKSPEKTLPIARDTSPSATKPKKFVYLNQKVQIPNFYIDRVQYISSLFSDEEMTFTVSYAPSYKTSTPSEIGKYFKKKQKEIVEITTAIIYYFYKTFLIDKDICEYSNSSSNNNNTKTPEEILQTGEINSAQELCILFREICGYAGVDIKIIPGYVKKPDYKVGDSLVRHYWCVLNCGIEKDYLIDPLLTIGKVNPENNNEFEKELTPFYFLTPPGYFLENHLPDNEKFQFVHKTIKMKEFTRKNQIFTETFFNGIYKYKFQLINYTEPEFNCKDSEIEIKFKVKDVDLDVDCVLNGKKIKEENLQFKEEGLRNQYLIKIIFPSNGEYKLNIYGKPVGATGERELIFCYRISVKITNIIKHEEPKKRVKSPGVKKILTSSISNLTASLPPILSRNRKIETEKLQTEKKLIKCFSDFDDKVKSKCYDSTGTHLFEPKTKFIKKDQEVKFKVRIRKAKYVVVLDGRKWNYLKRRDDDIYEGIIPIKNENVVICAMRNNDVYTEIYEFLAVKR